MPSFGIASFLCFQMLFRVIWVLQLIADVAWLRTIWKGTRQKNQVMYYLALISGHIRFFTSLIFYKTVHSNTRKIQCTLDAISHNSVMHGAETSRKIVRRYNNIIFIIYLTYTSSGNINLTVFYDA